MHNSIRVSVVATGIDSPKKVDNVENIISDINVTLEKNNTEKKLNLVDYKVRILTPQDGTKALVRVRIESRNESLNWSTIGVSYNVIDASYIALHDSITYHLLNSK